MSNVKISVTVGFPFAPLSGDHGICFPLWGGPLDGTSIVCHSSVNEISEVTVNGGRYVWAEKVLRESTAEPWGDVGGVENAAVTEPGLRWVPNKQAEAQ